MIQNPLKIEGLTSPYQAKELQGQVFVAQRIKTMNESIYYNIDMIHSAINSDRKIRFQYYNWSVDKKQELRHGGEYYSVSPWGVCWNDEWYYLIAFDDKSQEIRHYRVDKMKKLTLVRIGWWTRMWRFWLVFHYLVCTMAYSESVDSRTMIERTTIV